VNRRDLWENVGKGIAYGMLLVGVLLFAFWMQVTREKRLISHLLDEIQRRGMAPQAVPK
jgi:hypothetical protein